MTALEILVWIVAGGVLVTLVPWTIIYWATKGRIAAELALMEKYCDNPDCPMHGEEEEW